MKKHLAIVSKSFLDAIFDGSLTIDARFSKNRTVPYGQVSVGDTVYLKLSSEEIAGQYQVKKVISFDRIDPVDWQTIAQYFPTLERFQKVDTTNRFGTLIFTTQVERFITSPVKIIKKDNRTWMVVD